MMTKRCWWICAVLALLVVGMAYQFMIRGSVADGDDGRQVINLEAGERDMILAEMRMFLQSVQQITAGLSEDDLERVVAAARQSGMAAQEAVPSSVAGKLPLQFKQLGADTHRQFDTLALDAEQLGDKEHTLTQLGTLMNNCIACHASYRMEANR